VYVCDYSYVLTYAIAGPGTEGIECQLHDGTTVRSRQAVAFVVDDSRGMPHVSMQSLSPCYIGACKECDMVGIRIQGLKYNYYPGYAVSRARGDDNEPLRRWKIAFHDEQVLLDAAARKPRAMTHEKALASGRRALADPSYDSLQNESYHGHAHTYVITYTHGCVTYVCQCLTYPLVCLTYTLI
jgi:hypothetical protein